MAASELPASVDEATDTLLGMGRKRKRPEQTFAGTIRDAVEARVEERLKTLPLNLLRAMRCELEPTFDQPPTPSLALRRMPRAMQASLRRVLLAYSCTSLHTAQFLRAVKGCRTAVVISHSCWIRSTHR